MKKETEFALYKEIKEGNLSFNDVDRLFDIYLEGEIETVEDFHTEPKDFHSFIRNNLDSFDCHNDEEEFCVTSIAYDKVRAFKPVADKYFRVYRIYQEQFAKEVEELVDHDKSTRILEVGSGEVPYSSILLGRDGYNVTSMDNFCVSEDCLAKFNVKSFRQMFNAKTSVKNYDIVVARRPCSAIENIVANCHREKIPYFMRLCGCNAPGGHVSGWRNILSSIDEDIRYNAAYAYNLDGSDFNKPSKIQDLIWLDTDRTYS